MDEQIIVIYCLCCDVLQRLQHVEDRQCAMSDAEVLTTAMVAAVFFRGNFELARSFLREYHCMPHMLSKSHFNRRLHRIDALVLVCFESLAEAWKVLSAEALYLLDLFPVPVCDNYRIGRNKLYPGDESYRGYIASKKRFFYGVRVHLLTSELGQPVEFCLLPGSVHDAISLDCLRFDLPADATVYADAAYNDAESEALLAEAGLHLLPIRKRNMHAQFPYWIQFLQAHFRKRIETTGSLLERIFPKSIHAVTAKGFELKVALFVLALSLHFLW